MLSKEDMVALVAADERRLGVNSPEFMERHNEIMKMADEIRKVAHYNGIPYLVLTCPKVIMLDMGRVRHKKMVAEADNLCIRLKCMAREGNQPEQGNVQTEHLKSVLL